MFRSLLSTFALGAAITAVAAPAAAPAHGPPTMARACAPYHYFVAVPALVRPLARPSSRTPG